MKTSIILASIAALSAARALPSWEFAEWGLSPEGVVKSTNDRAQTIPFDPDNVLDNANAPQLASEQREMDGVPVGVAYYFAPETKQLSVIDLVPSAKDCDALLRVTEARYGAKEPNVEPFPLDNTMLVLESQTEWTDPANGNSVRFMAFLTDDDARTVLLCKVQIAP